MSDRPKTHSEKRWALAVTFDHGQRFIGKFCWPAAHKEVDAESIPTFRTRKLGREARKCLDSYRHEAKVVLVLVTIQAVEAAGNK